MSKSFVNFVVSELQEKLFNNEPRWYAKWMQETITRCQVGVLQKICLDTNQSLPTNATDNWTYRTKPQEWSGAKRKKLPVQLLINTSLRRLFDGFSLKRSWWPDVFKLLCLWIPTQWTKMDHLKITPHYAYLIWNTSLLSFESNTKEWHIHKFHNNGLISLLSLNKLP